MKRDFYKGPGGVFYDRKHDEIFILEPTGCEYRDKNNKLIGKRYLYQTSLSHFYHTYIAGMKYCERIGEL